MRVRVVVARHVSAVRRIWNKRLIPPPCRSEESLALRALSLAARHVDVTAQTEQSISVADALLVARPHQSPGGRAPPHARVPGSREVERAVKQSSLGFILLLDAA